VIEFPMSSPDGVVVNIGCGLDSRFSRIDNGRVCFHDLDLPDVSGIKRRFFEENDRYQFIASSVLDYDWMAPLLQTGGGPFLNARRGCFHVSSQRGREIAGARASIRIPWFGTRMRGF